MSSLTKEELAKLRSRPPIIMGHTMDDYLLKLWMEGTPSKSEPVGGLATGRITYQTLKDTMAKMKEQPPKVYPFTEDDARHLLHAIDCVSNEHGEQSWMKELSNKLYALRDGKMKCLPIEDPAEVAWTKINNQRALLMADLMDDAFKEDWQKLIGKVTLFVQQNPKYRMAAETLFKIIIP